ncbi:YajQ family cyclic di-GMP-binding protein [Cytophagaceae bacterium DM2B3-1]|uniref:Nucleotide-binding protein QNI16_36740 n=2 Tax=Xanthocytophaga TaxID=3078918 RepID=A0AAE3QZ43_9BACT|nr:MULTISPECIES: YajQ family cyclic di-GMP-binding protein [Xanthocytophaga]MDJ1473302.1 YajQ family cyclic di-GMP-binding protein [Xanthocytophaga flavus]MDJ1486088.1 YajQ family cyclic di-GMP-binding protein [Xanthocytophaga flavus]MDJ1497741.1 YajQ family cyclic di-GMP-binding protein [Xanthocytophaga flavus]MDJ1501152.1 YajQ family cyclic di-GMP-binding protein [Xanthocytophaga agilis]
MPSFDIVSKIDGQTLDNSINTAKKEILNRYDFHGSKSEIELDKKENTIQVLTENEMRMKAIQDAIMVRMAKQGLDPKSLDMGELEAASGNMVRRKIQVRQGIDKDTARKIVKIIKDSGLKVQPAQMDDQIRVTAKKIDDLQAVIAKLRASDIGLPLQFVNMKS